MILGLFYTMNNEWLKMYQCDKCGHISGWKKDEVCGGCGDKKEPIDPEYPIIYGYKGWNEVIAKWGFIGNKFNPFTWSWGWKVKKEDKGRD